MYTNTLLILFYVILNELHICFAQWELKGGS